MPGSSSTSTGMYSTGGVTSEYKQLTGAAAHPKSEDLSGNVGALD